MTNPDPNTADLTNPGAPDPDAIEVYGDHESHVDPDWYTPAADVPSPHDEGPYDPVLFGVDSEGRWLNSYGRYAGQNDDEDQADDEPEVQDTADEHDYDHELRDERHGIDSEDDA